MTASAQQGPGRGAVHYGAINKFSAPSDLKITDIRALRVAANFDYPIIKIFTNQDVMGSAKCATPAMKTWRSE
ncbi:MAG: hypothetical protein WDO73_20755 [Ignavibacteriota bacterium]